MLPIRIPRSETCAVRSSSSARRSSGFAIASEEKLCASIWKVRGDLTHRDHARQRNRISGEGSSQMRPSP